MQRSARLRVFPEVERLSKVRRGLQPERKDVVVLAGATRMDDILEIRAKERTVPGAIGIVQFESVFGRIVGIRHTAVQMRRARCKADIVLGARLEEASIDQ